MKSSTLSVTAVACFALALAGCGGGGSSSGTNNGGNNGGATGTVSQGVITAKGSIFVNGIEYSTTNATITIDDKPGQDADLKEGMIVKVRGTHDDLTRKGVATKVEARDAVEGLIDDNGVDPVNHTISVMGQLVRIEDNVTRLNDDNNQKTFASGNFQPGDRVEVHAYPDDQGGLRATRVAKKATGEFEIKGFVASIGSGSFTLSLTAGGDASLVVNFSGSLPAGVVVGSPVEVKAAAAPVAGAVTATKIELEDRIGAAGEKVEVEGLVSSGTVADFVINGQRVITNSATVFEGGSSSDFVVGGKLEAEGTVNAVGTLVASKIQFKSNIKIEADVTAADEASLTLLGQQVALNGFTRLDSGVPAVGAHVVVTASRDRNGGLIASRVTVVSASTKSFLQGPVTVNAGALSVLGVTIATNGGTEFQLGSDETEQLVSAATFLARLTSGVTVIKVRWNNFTSTSAPIDEAEIETGK